VYGFGQVMYVFDTMDAGKMGIFRTPQKTYACMKLNLILLTILCCCSRAIAQQKFIEVTVSDTVVARADVFVYKVSLIPGEDYSSPGGYPKDQRQAEAMDQRRKVKLRHTFDSLRSALKGQGFVLYKPSLEESVNIYQREVSMLSVRVLTHSVDSLEILSRQLQRQEGLTGFLEVAVAAHDSVFQKRLFKKNLEKAWAKAESIANYSNQHVRGVLTVTENKDEGGASGGWTSYPPLSYMAESVIPGWHTSIKAPVNIVPPDPEPSSLDWYPIAGTFTIRFWIE